MPRKTYDKICCACLCTPLKLKKLSLKDENKVSLQSKLRICIPEIEWLSTYQICEQCGKLLDISYTFRETCLNSDLIRQQNVVDKVPDDNLIKYEVGKGDLALAGIEEKITFDDDPELGDVKYEIAQIADAIYEENSDDEPDYINYPSDVEDRSQDFDFEPQQKRKRKRLEFACEKCDNIYHSSKKLVDHCIKNHEMKQLEVRPFICDRCPSRFCKSSNLLQHVKYHEAVRSNMCTYCGKGFITKTDLNIHEKQHLNKREYRCDECGKCFNTHKDIRSHKLVVHTDSNHWKYCCEICNKPFPIKSNYDSHMRRHTGDKKFECHLCQRKFTDKCVLQRHMRTHSNVREYKCAHCEREYKDPRVLKVHMAKIHSIGLGQIKIPIKEKKYICHICPKSYYAKNKLTRHLYTHTGEKPFDCAVCGKKFTDRSYVKQHLRKTHNMDDCAEESNAIADMNGIIENITERNIKFEG